MLISGCLSALVVAILQLGNGTEEGDYAFKARATRDGKKGHEQGPWGKAKISRVSMPELALTYQEEQLRATWKPEAKAKNVRRYRVRFFDPADRQIGEVSVKSTDASKAAFSVEEPESGRRRQRCLAPLLASLLTVLCWHSQPAEEFFSEIFHL